MREFLEFIQPDVGFTEVRAIMAGKVQQHFTESRQDATDVAMARSENGWDAYYGVLPRARASGTADDVWSTADVLWADMDAKDRNKAAALQQLIDYEITPSVIVDSGHGYHAYWKLTLPIPTLRACHIMKGLALHLDGDHVYDPPRILRVPGTTNWKDPGAAVTVRVLRFDTTRLMRPGDFEHAEATATRQTHREVERTTPKVYIPRENRGRLPDWLDDLINQGAPQGSRSELVFKVAANLQERGWSYEEFKELNESAAIGEKYREMRRGGERWLRRTWERAR
jgi:hypothetical protein